MNKTRDGIMTTALVFIVVALVAILLLHDSGLDLGNSTFMSYVDVILSSDSGATKRYAAVAYSEYTKSIDPFEPEPMTVLVTSDQAYTSVTDADKRVTNTLVDARLFDEEGNEVSGNARAEALLNVAQDIGGAIRRVKIFDVEGEMFAQVTVYIAEWETNALYHFIKDDTELRHLCSFPDEEVAGFRLKVSSRG